MKEAIAWTKKLEEARRVENILTEAIYDDKNKDRIIVLLTQVAFEVYIHEIQKAQGSWKKSMRYEDRLNDIKEFVRDEYVRKDLKQMYDIRAEYAHKLTPDQGLIKSKLNGLEMWTKKTKTAPQESKYVFASHLYLFKLNHALEQALQWQANNTIPESASKTEEFEPVKVVYHCGKCDEVLPENLFCDTCKKQFSTN